MPDRSSFEALYADAAPALFAWARLRIRPGLRERLDPEDLVQEVCVRAFEGFGRWDPARGSFRGWLFGIGNRVLRGALEELGRGPRSWRGPGGAGETGWLERVPDGATSITRRVVRDEATAAFCGWVEGLEEGERTLLVLRGLEGLPLAAVGERLGVGEETAKKRWQRLAGRVRERGLPAGLRLEGAGGPRKTPDRR